MARNDNERLTRSEQNHNDIEDFLKSDASGFIAYLYSSEIKRLEKDFPQITIEKGNRFKSRLYICVIRRK